ncbi:MAG: S-methyl-5-thioribose-1-phosphate isomerase [Spirochaetales bacterium]|nr:S-methyl-5-thioribose-1-phosphate isomerase [Spirochaetales bacterium]
MNEDLQSIWYDEQGDGVRIIDQRRLPFSLEIEEIRSVAAMCEAIRDMHLRGAPLIGVAAAYGMYLACRDAGGAEGPLRDAATSLAGTRPTAVNLSWALGRQLEGLLAVPDPSERPRRALAAAREIEAEDIERCRRIGEHGLELIRSLHRERQRRINILTHCNAGWLACVRYGTATAPMYVAHEAGIPLHVWVDETRPRNQGARLTAWELGRAGIDHTVIADNVGGHLMQHGMVDLVIVGSDRTTRSGDVANKIGTYLKALAARDNGVPFYVALPSSTIDRSIADGVAEIPIEERDPEEVRYVEGWLTEDRREARVLVPPETSPAANYAFDVTPSRLVSGLITERGICAATEEGIRSLFPRSGSQS